eukprot:GHUV01031379.1.p3 GENE.GHUV01031379.1~~GHUV01031379.1.p3  ORF type:complete len:109 (+),score=43.09 GHUV01031379.1:1138-1464(+)
MPRVAPTAAATLRCTQAAATASGSSNGSRQFTGDIAFLHCSRLTQQTPATPYLEVGSKALHSSTAAVTVISSQRMAAAADANTMQKSKRLRRQLMLHWLYGRHRAAAD